jgi:hypothetical protein
MKPRQFFVMLIKQRGGVMPLVDEDGNVKLWESDYEARHDAWMNPLAEAFGYEIFELGEGAQ